MGKDVYKFLPMTVNMPKKPIAITMDPFERNQIYIGTSQLMGMSFGEGVFAKRAIPGNIYQLEQVNFLINQNVKCNKLQIIGRSYKI